VLFVVGKYRTDDCMEVPLEDVVRAYLDDEDLRRFLVVEADREGNAMTFFADVTLEENSEAVEESVDYVRAHAKT
jgi:hypothetical protein